MALTAAILIVLGAWVSLAVAFGRRLHADWREPVLAAPVLIVESDDWGPGPPEDADRLRRLATVLQESSDEHGRHPVVTLGVVLAVPDSSHEDREGSGPSYVPRALDQAEFAPLRDAMLAGRDAGVFALQLHGKEHFWPPALLKAAQRDDAARAFLDGRRGMPRHESLAPHLQARWVDASQLPSTALDRRSVVAAVADETACFARVFGQFARVAIPVTFTWTTEVEAAWANHGVRVIVTPGTRNVGRDVQGRPAGDGSILRNGDAAAGGAVFVVRDIYFEPALGHTAERTLPVLNAHYRLGRPALLEMHRFNFTGDEAQAQASFAELRRLLQVSLQKTRQLRFMSTEALADALVARDPSLVDLRLAARVRAFILRAATQHRLRKLAWFTGLALVAVVVLAIVSASLRPLAPQPGPR